MPVPIAVVHVPHSSTLIPAELRPEYLLDDRSLNRELMLMTDRYTDELFSLSVETATTVAFEVSRLVVDPERFVDDELESMSKVGMGVLYDRTSNGEVLRTTPNEQQRRSLLDAYYYPHHKRITTVVQNAVEANGRCLIVDAHSFPSRPLQHEPDQRENRCDICIGTDSFHTPKSIVDFAEAKFIEMGYEVEIDRPFSGSLVPMEFYQQDQRIASIMIEVNRKLYMNEANGEKLADFASTADKIQSVVKSMIDAFS